MDPERAAMIFVKKRLRAFCAKNPEYDLYREISSKCPNDLVP
mgnify:CR=1 FL=1